MKKFNSKYADACNSIICLRQDGFTCDNDGCDIERGVIVCTCDRLHLLPAWRCRVHGDVVVPMD